MEGQRVDRVARHRKRERLALAVEAAQHRVGELARAQAMPPFGKLDGLRDRRVRRHALHEQELRGAESQEKYGAQEGVRFTPVAEARQKAAVKFLVENAFATPDYFLDVETLRRIEPVGAMDRIGQEEIFGPVLSVIPVDGYGEAMLALNQTRYGLSSSIFTRDVNVAFRAMRDFETGIVYVNAGTTGAETHLPFGGWKETGNGHREAGHVAIDTYTEWKSIYVDYSGRLQRAQIDNIE